MHVANNPFKPDIVSPGRSVYVQPGTNPLSVNFSIETAAARIHGEVVDEAGNQLSDWSVYLARNDQGVLRNVRTYMDGSFDAGILAGELNGQTWRIQAGDGDPMSQTSLMAMRQLPAFQNADSLYRRMAIYSVNSQIEGQSDINGSAPGFPMELVAWNEDTAQIGARADGGTGNFTIE